MSLLAKEIMLDKFETIQEEASAYEAIKTIVEQNINILPVVDEKHCIKGIISETDLVYVDKRLNIASYYAPYEEATVPIDIRILNRDIKRMKSLKMKEIMITKVISVSEDTSLEEIIDIVINQGVKTIPVVKDKKAIGMITRKCLLNYYIS